MLDPSDRPQDPPSEFRGRLGRRLAVLLIPLVLLPVLAMGLAAYLRSRALLENQASGQMTSAALTQIQVLQEWTDIREQRLQLGSQRIELIDPITDLLISTSTSPIYTDAKLAARNELEDLRSRQGENLFTHLLVARLPDGEVLVATEETWEGSALAMIEASQQISQDLSTTPLFDDPLFSPATLAFVASVPLRATEGQAADSILVGVNSGLSMGSLLEEMQIFWEQRGVYRVERGQTFVLLAPDVIIQLPRYSMLPEVIGGQVHPIFERSQTSNSGVVEYVSPDDIAVLAAFEWVPEWNLGVVVELPQEDIFAEITTLTPFSIALIAVTALLTLAIVVVTTNRILRPLRALTEFAERFARGDWLFRVPVDRDDEFGALASGFNQMAEDLSGLYRSLEDRVEARTRQIRTASEVARAVISTPSLDSLLRRAVELIQLQFDYYHVSIYLLDDKGEYAELREATGEIGEALRARRTRTRVGSPSIIGWVTANNQPRLASEASQDRMEPRDELLGQTRSQLAVPLQIGGRVLGVLDVHSTHTDAFRTQEIEVLQTLADQLSAAIQNARLAETSATAADRARLISEITTDLSKPLDIDEVLHTAARALQSALGQPEIMIKIHAGDDGAASDLYEPDTRPVDPDLLSRT